MSPRSRITTFIIIAVVFLALVFGARGIARGLAAPFEGLEQFAKARGVIAPEPENEFREPLRNIDWDAPAYAAPAPRARSNSKALPRLAFAQALRIEAGEDLAAVSLYELAGVEFRAVPRVALVLGGEPDLESLTSTLNLTESQKAMVSSLLEWRKWSLDALAEVNGDEESKEQINKSFKEAVELMLDPDQREKYKLSNRPLTSLVLRASLTEAGNSTVNSTVSQALRDYIHRTASEGK